MNPSKCVFFNPSHGSFFTGNSRTTDIKTCILDYLLIHHLNQQLFLSNHNSPLFIHSPQHKLLWEGKY